MLPSNSPECRYSVADVSCMERGLGLLLRDQPTAIRLKVMYLLRPPS